MKLEKLNRTKVDSREKYYYKKSVKKHKNYKGEIGIMKVGKKEACNGEA